jgi:hypothetical protein
MAADSKNEEDANATTNTNTGPKPEDLMMPPTKEEQPAERTIPEPKKVEPVAPKPEPTAPTTRPREAEKKKGKKGNGEP